MVENLKDSEEEDWEDEEQNDDDEEWEDYEEEGLNFYSQLKYHQVPLRV